MSSFRYGTQCKGCRALTLNLNGYCRQCQAGAPQDARGPERVRRELMARVPRPEPAWLGRLCENAFGHLVRNNGETAEGAERERRDRVSAYRWWIARHKQLPRRWAEAVVAWESAGCPRDKEEAAELEASR